MLSCMQGTLLDTQASRLVPVTAPVKNEVATRNLAEHNFEVDVSSLRPGQAQKLQRRRRKRRPVSSAFAALHADHAGSALAVKNEIPVGNALDALKA